MTIGQAHQWRSEAISRFRAESEALKLHPGFERYAAGLAAAIPKLEAMSDVELLEHIAAERHMSDKMTSGA